MPEASFLCLDTTEFMRNGDQFPNRFLVVQEAANLLVNAKIQINAENTVGFLTLGGNACTVFETLTQDVDRVMSSLTKIPISGKQCHFSKGLQIACLALSHRTNPRAEKRVVAFIGTPLSETDEELDKLARKLRKDDVAVDVVGVGVESNVPRLAAFVEKLNKHGNSRFLNVASNVNLIDALMSSPILLGADNVPESQDHSNEYQGFGIDPSTDPELALAIRMSLEEEQQRQAAAAALEVPNPAPTSETNQATTADHHEDPEELENMSEEELLARALQMSLDEAQKTAQTAVGSGGETPQRNLQEEEEEEEEERARQHQTRDGGNPGNEKGTRGDKGEKGNE